MTTTYTKIGDYLLPNLAPSESPKVGRWGMLRFNYLRKHREALYTIMLTPQTEASMRTPPKPGLSVPLKLRRRP